MNMKALVTGGAGFIGSHIVDLLLKNGYEVRILDNLELPTHLNGKPSWIPEEAEFLKGDVRNEADIQKALEGVDFIFHEAATGGFTPEISKYVDNNSLGTAKMIEMIIKKDYPIKKMVVASSIAVYGEGKYKCPEHGIVYPDVRPISQLLRAEWEVKCPICKSILTPLPTDEDTPVSPEKVYSITKYDQERLFITLGRDYGIPSVALRYFVTYGPRQSIFNPYTGVCSIFSTRILNSKPPIIYEDGNQSRDFVYVGDVATANLLVAKSQKANYEVFNVGTGNPITILDVASTLSKKYGKDVEPMLRGEFRSGDVRHMVADITKIKKLGFEPKHTFEQGIQKYIDWIKSKGKVQEYFSDAEILLKKMGVIMQTNHKNSLFINTI